MSACCGETGSLVGVAAPSSATGVRLLKQTSMGFSAPSIDFHRIVGACGIFFRAFLAASSGLDGSGVSLVTDGALGSSAADLGDSLTAFGS